MRFVLACREKGESFASLCRRFGISRKSGYKWRQRYREGGVRGLEDASRRPRYQAKAHRSFWRERLRQLREAHPRWGPKKLRRLLQKSSTRVQAIPAVSTLGRWLAQSNLISKRPCRARSGPVLPWQGLRVARRCNEVWSVDFKGWFRTGAGGRCEPLTVRDMHSRFVLAQAIRVDNGAPFGGKGALGLSRLSVWWLRLGIAVEFIRRAHPQDNGAHEQMHRILKADIAAPPARSLRAQKRGIGVWIARYNTERPHEALGQEVPARFYRPSPRRMPRRPRPAKYPGSWKVRRVRNRGHIKWEGRQRFIGRAFVGELVGLKNLADGSHEVYLERHLIGVLYGQDLAGMRPVSRACHP